MQQLDNGHLPIFDAAQKCKDLAAEQGGRLRESRQWLLLDKAGDIEQGIALHPRGGHRK